MSNSSDNKVHLSVIDGVTCFGMQEKYNIACQREKCQNWILKTSENNCAIISAKNGPATLHDIGSLFNLTRMRICQLEKKIFKKITNID